MSNKLKISQNVHNTTLNLCTNNTILEDEWAEDVGGFWDDEIPEVVNQPDTIPEQISVDEIIHIKVSIVTDLSKMKQSVFKLNLFFFFNRKMKTLY